ncbi:MAG: hypothetical protein K6F91_09505 [Ruminococcus sp.]|nr:hypothetical protein [Ruminococcus sp.]
MKKAIILILAACALLCGCSQTQDSSSSAQTEKTQMPVGPETEFSCEMKIRVTGTDDKGRLVGEFTDDYESGGITLKKGERVVIDHSDTIMFDLIQAEKATKSQTDAELDYGEVADKCKVNGFKEGTVVTIDELLSSRVTKTDNNDTLIVCSHEIAAHYLDNK